jgi:hypothetical protein
MRNLLIRMLIWLIDSSLSDTKRDALTDEQTVGLLSQLWENPAFRNYVSDRNQRIIYTMAGAPGEKLGSRDQFIELRGQRLEILELASKAKRCFDRRMPNNRLSTDKSN